MAAYQPNGEPQAPPTVQYQAYYSQPTVGPSNPDTAPGNPSDGTTVNPPVAGGDYSQQQSAPSLPPTTSSQVAQASPLPPAQGVPLLAEPFPDVAQQYPTVQVEQIKLQPNPNQVSVNAAQIQQPTTVLQAQAQPPSQVQAPQVEGPVYSTPGSFEVSVQPVTPNQYTYVTQLPPAQQVQGFPPPVQPLGQPTTLVQTQGTAYDAPQANNPAYQYVQTAPGQATYMQTSTQLQYVPTPSTGPVIPQVEIPYFSSPPPTAPGQPSRASKIWNKEAAKSASKTAWKHSKNFLVKTNDVVEKAIAPIMPMLTLTDPDTAAAIRLQHQLNVAIKAQNAWVQGLQAGQQRPNSMAVNQQLVARLRAQLKLQQQAGGPDNMTPIIARLQANAQVGALPGQQAASGLEAALIAALLQNQAQQQQQQVQVQQQQQQGQAQEQQQQQQQIPLRKQPNRKPVPSVATNAAVVQNSAYPSQPQPNTAPRPSVAAQQEGASGPSLQAVLSALALQNQNQNQNQTQTLQSQPQQHQQGQPTSQPPTQPPAAADPRESTPAQSNWQHHRARVFGIQDMLLPPQHNLWAASRTLLTGDIAGGAGHFSIELLYNPTQLQRRVDALQHSLATTADPASTPLTADPASTPLTARPDLNAGAAMAADCVVVPVADGTASYVAVLQSPSQQGHGLCVTASATAAAADLALARAIGQRMVRSISWGDFALVCRDVSASVVGAWRWKEGEEGEGKKESVFDFNVGCRYVYDGPPGSVDGAGTGGEACESQRSTGSFQVFEYENGVCHLVLTDDDPGQSADVRVLERAERALVIEGRKYLEFSRPAEME